METRSISARPDVAVAATTPRVTPTPPRASRFGEVLANTAVRSAESAMRMLPGAPVMAVAVRSATGGTAIGVPMSTMSSVGPNLSAEGPTSYAGRSVAPSVNLAGAGTGAAGASAGAATGAEGAGLDAALQQSQDMNLYYLQVQEAVNAQNRSFTTMSNILKAQHDTVKTAIGNIR